MPPANTPVQQSNTGAPASPVAHEHDQIAVTNIDLNCDFVEQYTVERSIPVAPVQGDVNPLDIPRHESQQVSGSFNHKDYFEVRYNGTPFRLRPNETRTFPRYLAEHFAKHLADHMLGKMEQQTGRQGLIQSNVERPKMLARIMEIKQWYLQDAQPAGTVMPGATDDPGVPTQDLGHVPSYAVGNLTNEPKTAEQILAEGGEIAAPGTAANPEPPVPPAPATTGEATPNDIANQKDPAQTPSTPNTDPTLPPSNDTPNSPDLPQVPPNPTGPVLNNNLPPTSPDPANPDNPNAAVPGERSKADYIREAVSLGIEVNGRESVEDLRSKITAFATPR